MPDWPTSEPRDLWRAYVPRWAHEPLSGEGAARFGGRWNPVGQPCLYLACEMSTAWAEYNQGFVQHPATIVRLVLRSAHLADLTQPQILEALDLSPAIHRTEWRDDLDQGRVPASHRLTERLRADGCDGLVYPSVMSPGGTCVALWRWNQPHGAVIEAVDPEGRLPRTQASWL